MPPVVFFVGEPKMIQAIKTALDALDLIRNESNDIVSAALANSTFLKVAKLAAEHWDKVP